MNTTALRSWLDAMIAQLPHGGKTKAAGMLGISPSGLSKLLSRNGRGFDEKTIRCSNWILTSKAERYSVDQFPIVREGPPTNGIVVETRRAPDGTEFLVWRKA
jgi:hypothetical protein